MLFGEVLFETGLTEFVFLLKASLLKEIQITRLTPI